MTRSAQQARLRAAVAERYLYDDQGRRGGLKPGPGS